MIDWRQAMLSPHATLGDALARIDQCGLQIALVSDSHDKLVGVVTDGDARRAVLQGMKLDASISDVMNTSPLTLPVSASRRDVLAMMKRHVIHQVPIVDGLGRIVGLEHIDQMIKPDARPNWVVIMAGGTGSRLLPLTENTPKPMLQVGAKPILETILEGFAEQGFSHFFLSVSYKADAIREYFGSGERWGLKIEYLSEDKRLGTAGALSLLPSTPTEPILVMNGDLLTRADYGEILEHHAAEGAIATMVVCEYESQVPFGVVTVDGVRICDIVEKPIQRHFVNAGIYVLSPTALKHLPQNEFFDMPSLFKVLLENKLTTTAFPLRDYWLDVGRKEELERAHEEWGRT